MFKSISVYKSLLLLTFLAVFLMTTLYFLPFHSENNTLGGPPCLFNTINGTACTGEMSNYALANHHLSSLSNTFTAIPTSADLFPVITTLAFGLVTNLYWRRNQVEFYTQILVKQKWRDHQFLEKIFNSIKIALRSGILERKEPSLMTA